MNTTWKGTERRIAAALEGQRVGPSGKSTADVVTAWLSVECKHRRELPKWIKSAVAQARAAAGPGQLGIAVLHEKHKRGDDDLVLIRLGDFVEWFGGDDDG